MRTPGFGSKWFSGILGTTRSSRDFGDNWIGSTPCPNGSHLVHICEPNVNRFFSDLFTLLGRVQQVFDRGDRE